MLFGFFFVVCAVIGMLYEIWAKTTPKRGLCVAVALVLLGLIAGEAKPQDDLRYWVSFFVMQFGFCVGYIGVGKISPRKKTA